MHPGSDRCPACERPLFGDEVRSRAHGWFRVDQVKAQSVSWRVAQVQKPEVGMPIITLGAATPHTGKHRMCNTSRVQSILVTSHDAICKNQLTAEKQIVGPSNSRPGHSLINIVSSVYEISLSHVSSDCPPMGQCSDEIWSPALSLRASASWSSLKYARVAGNHQLELSDGFEVID